MIISIKPNLGLESQTSTFGIVSKTTLSYRGKSEVLSSKLKPPNRDHYKLQFQGISLLFKYPPFPWVKAPTFRRAQKRSTVGRRKNLLWVISPTYDRSHRRPTVGFFLSLPRLAQLLGHSRATIMQRVSLGT